MPDLAPSFATSGESGDDPEEGGTIGRGLAVCTGAEEIGRTRRPLGLSPSLAWSVLTSKEWDSHEGDGELEQEAARSARSSGPGGVWSLPWESGVILRQGTAGGSDA